MDKTTATDPNNDGDLWIECTCGGCGYQSRGPITHRRSCSNKVQYSAQPVMAVVAAAPADEIATFARDVRRSGLTRGRDAEVLQAVREGHLTWNAAMNTDD